MDLNFEEVFVHLSPNGRLEWELATTKALLVRSQEEKTRLMDLLSEMKQDNSEKVEVTQIRE